ncbi:hypothetical protein, partial [Nitrospira lenta]|uniref:hypothetical protein n=1 Tax=Nitrospira lenta TaxID=1436998 RepID=UPI0011B3899B
MRDYTPDNQRISVSRAMGLCRRLWSVTLILTVLGFPEASHAVTASAQQVQLRPDHATPGATVVLSGKGLGHFKS